MKLRRGKVYKFAELPVGSMFRLTMDGRNGWLAMRKKDPQMPASDFTKTSATEYLHRGFLTGDVVRTAPRGFAVEYMGVPEA